MWGHEELRLTYSLLILLAVLFVASPAHLTRKQQWLKFNSQMARLSN